ncbi:MAG: Asp-tRNA(Asn)/Glu-tRNA(Gln) amidotransferase subunit GatC [Deltaproteobacteria bacterium]|nr:Asp-tRNA(Asn)/Glu-tRNA(Gln) amidotransferase subunit GatC [Deltaproteobacteria bacterium]
MAITKDDVVHVAGLARLELTHDETELYTAQLKRILGYVEKLSTLDTSKVEPLFYSSTPDALLREDSVGPSLARGEALENAPQKDRGCFKVPRIIEQP